MSPTSLLLFVIVALIVDVAVCFSLPDFPSLPSFSYGEEAIVVGDGDRVSEHITAAIPRLVWSQANPDSLYTIVIIDPDAPSPDQPVMSEWLHWLLVNVRGSDLSSGDLGGLLLASYAPPTPPQNTGPHRYVLSIYEQSNTIEEFSFKKITQAGDMKRAKWNLEKWLKETSNSNTSHRKDSSRTRHSKNLTFVLRAGLHFVVESGLETEHQRELQSKQDM